ncbi:MAG TPA: DEAD/DEAH box helicase [Trueperaceae bacterium]|nr:DEAD/DEAH box helicase [Trueperaceae bacterium]
MTTESQTISKFTDLELAPSVLKALDDVGYETPTPIQAEIMPYVLEGQDVIGQAQTGTGKTAAFALPLLTNVNLRKKKPQVLVLAPTRELAIQVAEAFQQYASRMKGFHVLPIYGGQDYRGQIRGLRRGAQVVVGTPGRTMDHIRRGTLQLDELSTLVLDEADEMLRMGFIDDVEWILEQTPESRQIALFSATMPSQIRRIAKKYLNKPKEILIKNKTTTAKTVNQRYWVVNNRHKLDVLTRILEAEDFDGIIIFVRTKTATLELAEKLKARGYAATPLNGDIKQSQRERTINMLKKGKLDIVVATDVAARGLDVTRISHVINYDIPYDTESYVHRIGRTGRAGRSGEAILFVAPREKRMLVSIERATKQKISKLELPSKDAINDLRITRFKQRITKTLETQNLKKLREIIEQFSVDNVIDPLDIAAALAHIAQGETPLLIEQDNIRNEELIDDKSGGRSGGRRSRGGRSRDRDRSGSSKPRRKPNKSSRPDAGMERYRIEVGHSHNVKPGNIVGAIANEAKISSKNIGRIDIFDDYSTVDMPTNLDDKTMKTLSKARVAGQAMKITILGTKSKDEKKRKKRKPKPKKD